MNKELSDSNIVVSNENEYISKQTYDKNLQEILVLENKIELIDNKLNKLDKDLYEEDAVVFLSKGMLIAWPIIVLLVTMGGFIGGLFFTGDFLAHAISCAVHWLCYISYAGIPLGIWFGIVNQVYKKKVKKTKKKITISKKLKEEYEKELLDIKENQMAIEVQTITVNESIQPIKQTEDIETQINQEIEQNYTESLNPKYKKMVLRRNK